MSRLPSEAEIALTFQRIRRNRENYLNTINQRPIRISDPDLNIFRDLDRSGSPAQIDMKNPDGLDHQIKGEFRDVLTTDPLFLMARSWKTGPANLTAAIKRKGVDWVREQIEFVATKTAVRKKSNYLHAILARNP